MISRIKIRNRDTICLFLLIILFKFIDIFDSGLLTYIFVKFFIAPIIIASILILSQYADWEGDRRATYFDNIWRKQ